MDDASPCGIWFCSAVPTSSRMIDSGSLRRGVLAAPSRAIAPSVVCVNFSGMRAMTMRGEHLIWSRFRAVNLSTRPSPRLNVTFVPPWGNCAPRADHVMSFCVRFGLLIVRGYQLLLSPFAGGTCRFDPSCSAYAIDAIRVHVLARGGWM